MSSLVKELNSGKIEFILIFDNYRISHDVQTLPSTMFRGREWNRQHLWPHVPRRSPRQELFKIRVTKQLLFSPANWWITCCPDLLGTCLQCFWSHRAAGKLESGDFYGRDLEKQLNRELKMEEERLRHTQEEQDKNVLVRHLNIQRPTKNLLIGEKTAKTVMQK